MPSTDQARWFSEHVQPYEPALRAYLQKRFPALADQDDLLQETYIRTLRAQQSGRLTHARAYLFAAARNAAIDWFRRRRGQAHDEISESAELPLLDEPLDIVSSMERQQRQEVLLEAMLALPERCRQVMMLRHLDGLSYREIADRLAISSETVKVHMIKGMKDCTRFFHRRGLLEAAQSATRAAS
jgi:RNA polymerase sigma-70 factor (ECF subfamily)